MIALLEYAFLRRKISYRTEHFRKNPIALQNPIAPPGMDRDEIVDSRA
jgi:hypothetical protein